MLGSCSRDKWFTVHLAQRHFNKKRIYTPNLDMNAPVLPHDEKALADDTTRTMMMMITEAAASARSSGARRASFGSCLHWRCRLHRHRLHPGLSAAILAWRVGRTSPGTAWTWCSIIWSWWPSWPGRICPSARLESE